MFGVEQHEAELLDDAGAVLREQVRSHLPGSREPGTVRHPAHQRAPAQLDGRQDLRGAGRADGRHAPKVPDSASREPVQPAGVLEHAVGERQRIERSRAGAQHQCQQLVVAEAGRTNTQQLLAGTIGGGELFHLYSTPMTRWWLPALLIAALSAAACGDPPDKEMEQAQGAIDAARAAGADRYATAEYAAANDALGRARRAVTGRDYRQALNDALESREHARNAAREAADTKARLRSSVERSMADIAALLAQGHARVQAARKARVAARILRSQEQALAAADGAVQEAGAAATADNYMAAAKALEGVKPRIEKAIAALDAKVPAQTSRRRR